MMGSTKSDKKGYKHLLKNMKDGLKSFKNHFKGKSSQTSSRAESPIPTDAAISHPNKEIHEPETRLSSPPRVGMSESNEPTNPIRMSSSSAIQSDGMLSKPSQDTTSQRGYDNGNTSSKLWPKPITHVADNEANTEAATDSQSGNDPEELSSPDQLWAAAYKRLENDHPKLLYDYQKFLLSTGQNKCNQPKIDDGGWQTQIQKLAYERLEESQQERLSFQIREKDIIIRDQIQKAMSFIVSVKDVVGTAISSEPHAALGWAGAMFIFPLLKTMLDQDKYAIEGFDCSLSLLVRCELIAQDFMKQAPSNLKTSESYSKTIHSLRSKIIEFYYNVYKYHLSVITHFNHCTLSRFSEDFTVKHDWKGKTDEFKATEGEIRNDLQVLSAHKVKEIEERFGDFLSERQKLFEQYQTITGSLKDIDEASRFNQLPVAHSAAFESSDSGRQCCMPGTQSKTLRDIQAWVESPTGKPILWLHGMAGTGKSTISQTIATALYKKTGFTDSSQLSGKIYLGGTFFFKQDDTSRNQANVLFTTLAHQLAYKQFGLGNEIAKAIKTNASPSIGFRSLEVQWEELILKPLQTVQESFPGTRLVLIIDALDECQHKETRTMKANIRGILQSLEQLGNFTTNMQVRVLVTSRNESHISKAFELLKDSYEQVELPKVELDSSNNDITTFLENNLYQNENGNSSGMEWLGRGDFDKLVQKSGGLFIYAATACKFLGGIDEPKIAEKRLRMLLEGTPGSKSPESNLDDIYRAVLDSYTRDWTEDEKKGGHLLKEILGLIAILFKPLPIYSLAEFTTSKYEEFKVKERLDSVRSIVEVPGDREVPVSLVHLSFHEFFMDKRRCERTKFYVEPSIMHSHLLQRCLKIMSQQLHMDMCDLRKPGILFVEVPPTLVQQFISPHLQYACRYWVDHLLLAREARLLPNMLTDNGEIHKFLKTHILNWLEVLGLIGDIGSAVYAINHLRTLVNTSTSQELSGLLYDSYRFTLFNIPIIRKAPLQVHYSSVLFSPSASIVRHLFLEPLTEWIKLLPHVNETWGAELMTINTRQDELIDSIVSPDSKTIASLKDSVVYLWEAVTGIEITKIDFRPTDYVEVTSFSPDGKYIALDLRSGVVRLYDIETSETSDLLGHETCIKGLAFPQSPSSKLLASVSFDGSGDACFIWDVSRKEQILTIKPPEDYINKVAILPGNLIAIVSSPRYIREDSKLHIWDLNTRKSGVGLDLDGYAQRIAFSPDGDTVAVETFSKSINIYSTKTWCLRFTLPHDDDTYNPESVAFSSDGKLLMVYYRENRISLHNSDSGELIRKLYIEGDWLYAVFFPDGETLATTSWNQFRLWDLTTANEKKSSQDTITRLQLSHSGNNAMVGFKKRFMIWNLNESKCILEIPHKLLPSSNSRFALSRPDDYSSTYDIWCTETGNRLKNFPAIMGGIHFSPYGKIVAFTSPNSIRILEVDTWEECARFNFESNESLSNIYFSTDNKVILCAKRWIWNSDTSGSDTTVFCLITLETHDPYHLIEYDPCCTPRLSPDGTLVAFLPKGTRGYIHLLEVDTKKVRAKLQYSENSYTKILFSPDSTLIAVSHGERDTWFQVTLWNTAHGDMMSTSQRTDHEFIFMAVGPGGRVLITNQGDLSMWDPETNEVTGLAIFPPYDIELEEGGCLVSRYGRLPLPFTAKDFDCIYVDDDWVLQGGERLLWLPEAYRSKYFGISNDTLVRENTIFLSHESGFLAYIQINLENTPLAKQHKESLQVKQIGVEVTEVE